MRRIPLYTMYATGSAVGLVLILAAAFVVRVAIAPISLAPLGPDVREAISEKLYYAYDVKFDEFELSWSDGYGNLGLTMRTFRVADYSLQDIASVPEIVVGISPAALVTGADFVSAITVHQPKVRWIKTVGGAVKFDIGAKNPGDSGKILEDFLITMAAAPDPTAEDESNSLPELRIVDSEITIGNEADGSSVHLQNANILMEPDARGVHSMFDVTVITPAAPLHVAAEGLYRTADQKMTVTAQFSDLRLRDIWPDNQAPALRFVPDEPMTGTLKLEMDKFFGIEAAVLSAQGPETNIQTEATVDVRMVTLNTNLTLTSTSTGATWPSWLQQPLAAWLNSVVDVQTPRTLSLNGEIDRFSSTVRFQGDLSPSAAPLTVTGALDAPRLLLAADDAANTRTLSSGTDAAPNITN